MTLEARERQKPTYCERSAAYRSCKKASLQQGHSNLAQIPIGAKHKLNLASDRIR